MHILLPYVTAANHNIVYNSEEIELSEWDGLNSGPKYSLVDLKLLDVNDNISVNIFSCMSAGGFIFMSKIVTWNGNTASHVFLK